jgi:hypothetical protein
MMERAGVECHCASGFRRGNVGRRGGGIQRKRREEMEEMEGSDFVHTVLR